MGQAQEVVESLEAEIKELRKRDAEMKDLSRCEDHIHYLQTYESMCSPLESGEIPSVHVNHEASFEPVRDAVLDLREKVEDLCNQELNKINKKVNDTTLFTLGSNRGGTKAILKLFSGLGKSNANSRSASSGTSLSSGLRSGDKRGIGLNNKGPDVRSRDTPRANNSPRPRDRQRGQERESVRETNTRLNPSPRSSPTPSRRESRSLWSRSSSQSLSSNSGVPSHNTAPPSQPAQTAPQAAPSGGFSRMASISSIFKSRRGTNQATPATNNSFGGGMSTVPESPVEVNPGLFLDDSPVPETMNYAAAFPGLREISLDSIQAPEPRSREEFLQYAVSLTLDPNTAHKRLILSENNTKASLQSSAQPYPDTPQRFDGWTQVLCQSALYSQRSYWEVDWRGRGSSVGVVYGSISRKGSDARSDSATTPSPGRWSCRTRAAPPCTTTRRKTSRSRIRRGLGFSWILRRDAVVL
ncbi:hypothetical protein WMY93_008500 [Mugilogobius chulae]|uniref:B30.2/SPRY domain-containing protein n=1 Tax=Mugilogobius chulae TaxID=88201 RepID=A0AAW0PQ57_9GOBI